MRRSTLVTLLVVGALAYGFYLIPKLSSEQQQVKEYEYYTDFLQAFDANKIATVKLVSSQVAEGDFKQGAEGDYTKFTVRVEADQELVHELVAHKKERELDALKAGRPRIADAAVRRLQRTAPLRLRHLAAHARRVHPGLRRTARPDDRALGP